ncbi:hypothetical protein ACHAWF_002814 [Thalassiosira exigua]
MSRVKKPDLDNWVKLRRCLKYLKGMKHMKLTRSGDDLGVIEWWVDFSHNVHPGMRGPVSGMMSMGKGAIISGSSKINLNTGSSTVTELVGTHNGQWTMVKVFHRSAGVSLRNSKNILVQDNLSRAPPRGEWEAIFHQAHQAHSCKVFPNQGSYQKRGK